MKGAVRVIASRLVNYREEGRREPARCCRTQIGVIRHSVPLIALRGPAARKPWAYSPCTPVRRMRLTPRAARGRPFGRSTTLRRSQGGVIEGTLCPQIARLF
jgi:hypothetical protein